MCSVQCAVCSVQYIHIATKVSGLELRARLSAWASSASSLGYWRMDKATNGEERGGTALAIIDYSTVLTTDILTKSDSCVVFCKKIVPQPSLSLVSLRSSAMR